MSEERPIKPNPDEPSKDQILLEDGVPKVSRETKGLKKKVGIGFFVIAIVFIVGSAFFSHEKQETTETKPTEKSDRPNYAATKKEIHQPVEKVTVSPLPQTTEPSREELQKRDAFLAMQMKVYQVRQKAPIVLWESKEAPNVTQANPQALPITSMANPRLPLSQSQMDALKKAQSGDSNLDFQAKAEETQVTRVEATHITYPSETVLQGTMIPIILEPALNSDLPGVIRGHVTQDVYSADGSTKLIDKGSKTMGVYNSGIILGQSRFCLMWTRIVRTDNVSVMIGSPGADSIGMAGIEADSINRHFWERFGSASLVTVLGGVISTAGVSQDAGYNSASNYRMMMSQNFQQTANQQLLAGVSQAPTLQEYQGKPQVIFVNRDLSFHGVNQ